LLLCAGSAQQALEWRADGAHLTSGVKSHIAANRKPVRGTQRAISPGFRKRTRLCPTTAPVHTLRELIAAQRAGVDLVFVSPVFATRSHPSARTLGRRGFAALARRAQLMRMRPIALGGVTARRAKLLHSAYGWAAIDAWTLPTHAPTLSPSCSRARSFAQATPQDGDAVR